MLLKKLHLETHKLKDYLLLSFIFVLFVGLSLIFFNFFQAQDIWSQMKVAGGNAFKFCEFNHLGEAIVQKANTWSNLLFLVVGLFILLSGIKDMSNKEKEINLLIKYPAFSIIMGVSILYVFIGSFFYHASVTYFFQMLDQTGMYAIVFSFFSYHFFRLKPDYKSKDNQIVSSHKIVLAIFVLINIVFVLYLWDKIEINIFFPLLFFVYLGFTFFYNRKTKIEKMASKLLLFSLYTLLLSLTFWILDMRDIMCDPHSIFQGHALWHILNATVLLLIYLHYRAENKLNLESKEI